MDITITIPVPVLVSPQYFQFKYRLVGSPTWIDISPKTNAPFTITGLAAGSYEYETALAFSVSPLAVCDTVHDTFIITDDFCCIVPTDPVLFQMGNGIWILRIPFSLNPADCSPCYFEIEYGILGQAQSTIQINSPTSPIVLPATAGQSYSVIIRSFKCDGTFTECYNDVINPPEGGCISATITNAEIITNTNGWFIKLTITQSTPFTNPFSVNYTQTNAVTIGAADPGGTISLAANALTTILTFPISPNFNCAIINGLSTMIYAGSIIDGCRLNIKWQASFILS